MQRCSTAIEITNQWLKLVTAKSSLRGAALVNTFVKSAVNLKPEQVGEEISQAIKKFKIIPSPLVICYPRNLVTMRNIHLPSSEPKEINGMIDLHMGRQVPYPREEIVGGYHIIGTDEAGYSRVILAIAHREAMNQIFTSLSKANLYPEKIELSSYGAFSWFLFNQKAHLAAGSLYILLDIDSNFTDFMIADRDNLHFSRSIAYGADQLSVDPGRTKFAAELKQSLAIFQSEEMNKKPAKIFASGAVVNIRNLQELLEKELGVSVEAHKPVPGIPLQVSISAVSGLAIDPSRKKINFVLPEVQIRKTLKERSKDLIMLGGILMYLLLVSSGIFLSRVYNKSSYLKLLERRYKEIGAEVGGLEAMSRKTKIIRDRLNARATALNCLYQIHRFVPPNIVLKMVTLESNDKVALRGQAREMADVFKFVDLLKDTVYFKDVQIKYSTKKRIEDADINEFEIVCPIAKIRN